jgi:hypothetical protein
MDTWVASPSRASRPQSATAFHGFGHVSDKSMLSSDLMEKMHKNSDVWNLCQHLP